MLSKLKSNKSFQTIVGIDPMDGMVLIQRQVDRLDLGKGYQTDEQGFATQRYG